MTKGLLPALPERKSIVTGLAALDGLAPGGRLIRGAVHEVLSATDCPSFFLPAIFARSTAGWIAWCDRQNELFPPALQTLGVSLERLMILHPAGAEEELWSAAESLRCPSIAACVTRPGRLSQAQARRLQLAAERGGGIGILLRTAADRTGPYAAATRWLIRPAPGWRSLQRWEVELIHGHGGHTGRSVILEVCLETNHVRASEIAAAADGNASAVASA
jgi:protein ImuA